MSDSEFIRHIPCPECGSSDANSIYTDGHEFCHKCNYYKPADGTATNHTHHRVQHVRLQGSAGRLHSRGITEKTCELFKTYRDGELLRHYYFDGTGSPVGAKVRTSSKEFRCEGEVKTLFGMQNYRHKTSNKTQKLVITEGEMDAMSVWEAQPHWDVVSIPNGAAAAKKAIQNNYEWLQYYDKIVLFFDNDEAGHKGAEEAAGVMPPGKVYIGFLDDYKDASEALQAGDSEAIRAVCNFQHTQYKPDGIVDAKSLIDVITTPTPPSDHDYPFQGLQTSFTGSGTESLSRLPQDQGLANRPSVATYVLTCLTKENGSVTWHLKSQIDVQLSDLCPQQSDEVSTLESMIDSELAEAFDNTINNWNLHLFGWFGSYDPDHIYNRIEYMASGLETKVVFLDHLSILLSGLDGINDERKMIDQTMTKR